MFYPGQHVVCIKGEEGVPRTPDGWCPRTGGVYTVRSYRDTPGFPYPGIIRLTEYVSDQTFDGGHECGWQSDRFRPLDDTRLDIFRQHLVTPPKERVSA